MILLFLIVLFFVCYVVLIGCNLSRESPPKKNVFFLCCILVITAFIVYFIKRDKIALDFSLGAFFSLAIGPLLLLLLNEKEFKLITHFAPILLLVIINTLCFLLVPTWYNMYIAYFDDILFIGVIISCAMYGSYGYIYMVKNELNFINNSILICYIALVLSCAFFFGVLLFRSEDIFDIDYAYMIYCLFLMLVACSNELKCFLSITYLEPIKAGVGNLELDFLSLDPKEKFVSDIVLFPDFEESVVDDVVDNEVTNKDEYLKVMRHELFYGLIETKLYLESDLTLQQLSKKINIDKNELVDYFKNCSSVTFRQYINRLKVEHAINLIKEMNKDITVEELTVFCGFNTRLSFYRAFVHVYGFPPSAILNN